MIEETKENALPIKYYDSLSIIEANKLIRSKQDKLSLLEIKLIRLIISQITILDGELNTYTCNTADLSRYLGLSSSDIYRDIKKLVVEIMKKNIYIQITKDEDEYNHKKTKEKYKIFHWVDYVEYIDG